MMALYTILFFSDMAALVVLTYLFLKSLAHGCAGMQAMVWVPGIFFCIAFLVHICIRYLRLPPSQ